MATINDLAGYVHHFAGLDGARVRAVVRYLREAGILPGSTKGKQVQVEAVHAAALLIASAGGWEQVAAVRALKSLWTLRPQAVERSERDLFGHRVEMTVTEWERSAQTLGQAVETAISRYADDPHLGDAQLVAILLPKDGNSATIVYRGAAVFYSTGENTRRRDHSRHQQVRTITEIPWETLHWLGLIVGESRARAAERGVQIEVMSTWKALMPHSTGPGSTTSEPADAAEPEKTEAAEAPPSAASENGQPANELSPTHKGQLTRTHTGAAMLRVAGGRSLPWDASGDPGHLVKGSPRHGRPSAVLPPAA